MSIVYGLRHRDTRTGWEGVAVEQRPTSGRRYRLTGGGPVTAVGPHPDREDRWLVRRQPDGPVETIDRGLFRNLWPRVGLRGHGPKGAPELRFSDPDDLELVEDVPGG